MKLRSRIGRPSYKVLLLYITPAVLAYSLLVSLLSLKYIYDFVLIEAIHERTSAPLILRPISTERTGPPEVPTIKDPTAPDPNLSARGYKVVSIHQHDTNGTIEARLEIIGEPTDVFGNDFLELVLMIEFQTDSRLNIRIQPVNLKNTYIVPGSLLTKPELDSQFNFQNHSLLISFENDPFSLTITRSTDPKEILFSTKGNPLVFSNQFIQFNTSLPLHHNISGLGESNHRYINEPGQVKTLYASDKSTVPDANMYGTHPVYYDERITGSHAVYWRSSAIQEVIIEETSLTWRSLSGIIDLYFYAGPSMKEAMSQFVTSIGTPALHPYWTLGYHQSKWGYGSVEELNYVVNRLKEFDVPLETIWSDLDYMDNHRDFTENPDTFPIDKFQEFLQNLHDNNQHYIPIVDCAIYYPGMDNLDSYPVFRDALDFDVFIKNPDGSVYIGELWPGPTGFPDFFANSTYNWWTETFITWHDRVNFDGIWLDKNEPISHCVGSCNNPPDLDNLTELYNSSIEGKGNINYPPYAVNNIRDEGPDLAAHYVAPNGIHLDGTLEYDVHNLFGYSQSKMTYSTLQEVFPGKRPFIVSRSTHTGSGKYAAHWGGDNESKWEYLQFSISQAFSFGLFGIPFFGVDVCGFTGDADEELCSRWMQLGAFFPFFRNHNSVLTQPQEPYNWDKVAEDTKTVMNIRYLLLPYFYTLLAESHFDNGQPVLKALSWIFPNDQDLIGYDGQFFVGEALLVTPVLDSGVSEVDGVFPGLGTTEIYYDWYTYKPLSGDYKQTLEAPLGHIPLHIRGGNVLSLQNPGYTTTDCRNNPFKLIVALDMDDQAEGHLYLDDGESLDTSSNINVYFKASHGKLEVNGSGDYVLSEKLDSVVILGIKSFPSPIKFTRRGQDPEDVLDYSFRDETLSVHLEKFTPNGAFTSSFILSWS